MRRFRASLHHQVNFQRQLSIAVVASASAVGVSTHRAFFGPFAKKKAEPPQQQQQQQQEQTQEPLAAADSQSPMPGVVPPLPKGGNVVGVAKDMWNTAKAARTMAKELHPEGGRGAHAESQLAQLKSMLELQKKMAAQLGGGKADANAMAKMMNQSADMFGKMIDPMEKKLVEKGQISGAAGKVAAAAAAGKQHLTPEQIAEMMQTQSHPQQQQSQHQPPQSRASGGVAGSGAVSGSPGPTPPASQSRGGGGGGLPPEIEALFAELREMRAKKNEFRDKFNDADRQLKALKQTASKAQAAETDLRKRLSSAEQTVSLLQSESLELRDKKRSLESELKSANLQITKTAPSADAVASQRALQAELHAAKQAKADLANDVARLERKLRRLRRHSPMGDLSELLSDMTQLATMQYNVSSSGGGDAASASSGAGGTAAGGGAPSLSRSLFASSAAGASSDAAAGGGGGGGAAAAAGGSGDESHHGSVAVEDCPEFRSAVADDAFNGVRDRYDKLIGTRFPEDGKECDVAGAVTRVALEVVRSRLPFALLDCVVVLTDPKRGLEELQAVCREQPGWSISATPQPVHAGASQWTVTVTEKADASTPALGPYALLAIFFARQQATLMMKSTAAGGGATSSSSSSAQRSAVASVHPLVSPVLVENAKRTEILMDTARSSKPGGQASNVGETKITRRLLVDGVLVATAVSQDSRSAMHNKETSLERLMTEKLPVVNGRLRHVAMPQVAAAAGSPQPHGGGAAAAAAGEEAVVGAPATLTPCLESLGQEQGKLNSSVVHAVLNLLAGKRS